MALAVDGSSPALVGGNTATITTAAFSPPASSTLVAFSGYDTSSGVANNQTVASTGGLSWTLRVRKSPDAGSLGGAGQSSGCEIWTCNVGGAAPGSITVSAASTAGFGHALTVKVFTGAESAWAGAVAAGSGTTLPSVTASTTGANSWVWTCSSDWSAGGAGTAGSGETLSTSDEYHVVGGFTAHTWRQTATTAASGTSVTNNLTAPAAQTWNGCLVEVRATVDVLPPILVMAPSRGRG